LLRRVRRRLQVAIESRAIEGDDDDLAAVPVTAFVLLLFNIDRGQGQGDDMAVFDKDGGPLDLVPVVHGPVGVTDNSLARVVGLATVGPAVDAVRRGEVARFAGGPGVNHDVVEATGIPDAGVFEVWDALGINGLSLVKILPSR